MSHSGVWWRLRSQGMILVGRSNIDASPEARAHLDHRRIADLAAACVTLSETDGTSLALTALARRWQHLDAKSATTTPTSTRSFAKPHLDCSSGPASGQSAPPSC